VGVGFCGCWDLSKGKGSGASRPQRGFGGGAPEAFFVSLCGGFWGGGGFGEVVGLGRWWVWGGGGFGEVVGCPSATHPTGVGRRLGG
jgi:hypothetical protein